MKHIYNQMKKAIALVALFLMVGNVWAQTSWTGSSTNISVSINAYNQIGSTPVSIKCSTIKYNKERKGYELSGEAYLKSTQKGVVTITLQSVGANSYSRVLTVSQGSNVLASGEVAEVNSTAGAGTDFTFEMQANVEYKIENTTQWKQNFFIKKVVFYGPDSYLELDENTSKSENDGLISSNNNKKQIKLNRTLKAGKWNTFCLPLTINASQTPSFATQFKCTAAYELTGYNPTTGEITFSPIQASTGTRIYRAHTPCLIMPDEDIENPLFVGFGKISDYLGNISQLTKTVGEGNKTLSFIGVYGAYDITQDANSFFLSGGTFYKPAAGDGTIKGFRAYFTLSDDAIAAHEVRELTYRFEDDATGIIRVEKDIFGENGRVYTVDGRYVGDSKENLTRGMYIQNGRKFIVK